MRVASRMNNSRCAVCHAHLDATCALVDNGRNAADTARRVQETLAAQQLMLTQVCGSLQQLAAAHAAPPAAPPPPCGAPAAMAFLTNQAGFGGALALRALRRLASEADLTAAVLSRKILLADAAPIVSTPGQPRRHLTLRCAVPPYGSCAERSTL